MLNPHYAMPALGLINSLCSLWLSLEHCFPIHVLPTCEKKEKRKEMWI